MTTVGRTFRSRFKFGKVTHVYLIDLIYTCTSSHINAILMECDSFDCDLISNLKFAIKSNQNLTYSISLLATCTVIYTYTVLLVVCF